MNHHVVFLTCAVFSSFFTVSLGTTNSSWEHHIREDLLENYDRKVRPVLRGKRVVEVSFALRVSRLVKVDNKEQLVVLDTWVIQEWKNEFLTWNSSDYGDVDRVHFAPDEIWVPDIALFNNGDDEINLAGGISKFVTDVGVDSKGRCVWSGPATFKVNCEMEIDDWPFDQQMCQLAFGSYTYGKNLLKIRLFKDNKQFSTRFVRNGDWDITNITPSLNETDHGNCCPLNFSEVVYTLKMERKYLYYMFYVFIPSVLLTILALSSFLIHVESGERIGFVTTILLAMTVFLLVIPSFLPVTSDGLPVLGVNLQATMILIAVILFANIFVLRVYFKEGTPPLWVEKFCNFLSFKKSPGATSRPSSVYPSAARSLATVAGVELNDFSRGSSPLVKASIVPEFTWRRVSMKLDHVFFVVFIIISSITYAVTFTT
ncbi:neuronal acetylcholine receptor subunit alpha-7-like [Stylophora pistillata]|uniref:neuronal acetylcholine receptor subunit alpha-7-like n=1 Tax=Stylophora pistillata TaxID=50429 RepID=UPI000C045640|nr:neuronal acetylcholine receptor subunit alpha-7-like [Stylophora pistillata]